MKLILSRKGFDSGSGGNPSPVLPDGTMLSLPIPESLGELGGAVAYEDIAAGPWGTMASVAHQLGVADRVLARGAHLDPDLVADARPRRPGWCPSFGQAGAAAGHLANQGVGPGDLFVFWGLYRRTLAGEHGLMWDPASKPFHAVFGWMRIGAIFAPDQEPTPDWAYDHPHVVAPWRKNNALYVANSPADAGILPWAEQRRLTRADGPLSCWELPADCHPNNSGAELTYHKDLERWTLGQDTTLLSTVGRGQEFVVEATDSWTSWARTMLL